VAGLEFGLASASVSIIITGKPEIVGADPHHAQEFAEPEALGVGHIDVESGAVLLLEVDPVFRELSTIEVVPADSGLLFQEALVSRWVMCRVKVFVAKEIEQAFSEDVEKH
jgi:hypothetical protein